MEIPDFMVDQEIADAQADAIASLLPNATAAAEMLREISARVPEGYIRMLTFNAVGRVVVWAVNEGRPEDIVLRMGGVADFLVLARRIIASSAAAE